MWRLSRERQMEIDCDIPHEALRLVFSYLSFAERVTIPLSLVCRAWRDVYLLPEFWSNVDLDDCNEVVPVNPAFVDLICRASTSKIHTLVLTHHFTPFHLINLTPSLETLRTLHVEYDSFYFVLASLLEDCPQLTDLALLAPIPDPETLDAVASTCPVTIERLDLSGAGEALLDSAFVGIISRCGHSIRELILTSCFLLSDHSFDYIAQTCPNLNSINLTQCNIEEKSLVLLGASCPQLRTLCISDDGNRNQTSMSHLVAKVLSACHITSLDLCGCSFVDDAILQTFVYARGGFLTSLRISSTSVTSVGVMSIAEFCTALEDLAIKSSPQVSSQAIVTMLRKLAPKLKHLNLSGMNLKDMHEFCTTSACICASHTHSTSSFSPTSTTNRQSHSIQCQMLGLRSPQNPSQQHPHSNGINSDFSSNDQTTSSLTTHSHSLQSHEHIHTNPHTPSSRYSYTIGPDIDQGLHHRRVQIHARLQEPVIFLAYFPTLIELDLTKSDLFDRDFVALLRGCSNLKTLRVSYALNLTNSGLVAGMSCCSRLRDLEAYSFGLTVELIEMLVQKCCPSLQSIHYSGPRHQNQLVAITWKRA